MCLLMIRFMTLYTESIHSLTSFDDPLMGGVFVRKRSRECTHFAFEAWMLQTGETAVRNEKQCFQSYLRAAAIQSETPTAMDLTKFLLSCHTVNVQADANVGSFGARFPVVRFDLIVARRLLVTLRDALMLKDIVAIYLELERRERAGELKQVFEYVAAESKDRLERPLSLGFGYHFDRLEEGFEHVPGQGDKHIRSWYRLPSEAGLMVSTLYELRMCKVWFIANGFVPGEKVLLPK